MWKTSKDKISSYEFEQAAVKAECDLIVQLSNNEGRFIQEPPKSVFGLKFCLFVINFPCQSN